MLLLVTPCQILQCDETTGRVRLLRAGDGEYYGLSWGPAGTVVVSHSGLDHDAFQTHEDYTRPPTGYVSIHTGEGERRTRLDSPAGLVAPHQIELVDELIVATNTGRNCIVLYDLNGRLVRERRLVEARWDVNPDGSKGNHFNSVHRTGDRLWVVSHNFERPSCVWELSWPGLETVQVHETRARWAHNFWVGEYGPVVCNSKDGSLLSITTNETIWKAPEDHAITRGLAVLGDHIFVGRSAYAPRGERKFATGGLWVIDRKSLKTLESYVFPGVGCINEVRGCDGRDEAHVETPFDRSWLTRIGRIPTSERLAYELRRRPRAYSRIRKLTGVGRD